VSDRNRGATFEKIADWASALFVITPFVCVIWIAILFYTSSNGRLSEVTPLKILVASGIPTVFGLFWLTSRYAETIFTKYPVTTTWQFKVLIMFTSAGLIVLGAVVHGIMRGLKRE
jgi:hypothetical protein